MKGKRFFLKRSILFISVLSLFLIPTLSSGATFCINNATGLQTGLTTAASNGEGDTIQIVQGTYNGNFTYAATEANSLTVEGGYTEGCASREIDPANTVLDGSGIDTVLALVSQGAANFSVEGLTVRNGNASTVNYGGGIYTKSLYGGDVIITNNTFTGNTAKNGGGVCIQGSGTLSNNTFNGNAATSGFGGGAYVTSTGTLTGNTFSGNTATSGSGGGAYVGGGASVGTGTLTGNTFSGNTANDSGGGAWVDSGTLTNNVFTQNTAKKNGGGLVISHSGTLDNNTFSDNSAALGGGVYGGDTLTDNTFTGNTAKNGGAWAGSGTLSNNTFNGNAATSGSGGGANVGRGTLTGNIFSGNTAASGSGGGVWVGSGTLSNNTFNGNTAGIGGGAYVGGDSPIIKTTLTNNTFSGNTATTGSGGGASVGGGTLTGNIFSGNTAVSGSGGGASFGRGIVTNNVFSENTSGDKGGGIYSFVNRSDALLTLTNNTIARNTAENQGGGIWITFAKQEGEIYNNIIWTNSAPNATDLYIDNTGDDPFFPVAVDLFNNDFDQSSSGTYIAKPFTIDASNLDNVDPLFVGSSDFRLTASSPCIDTGDNDAPDLPDTDKDGKPRIIGGIVDMGAYEFRPLSFIYVDNDDVTCGGNTPCYATIQAAIDAAETESIIRILQGTFDENIITDQGYGLILSGGWDSTFTTQSSDTLINSLTIDITSGTVEIDNITLQYFD